LTFYNLGRVRQAGVENNPPAVSSPAYRRQASSGYFVVTGDGRAPPAAVDSSA
jgi:hypothetical protein